MTHLLAAEWLKLRKRLMVKIIVGLMLVIVCLIFWGIGTSHDRVNLILPRGWVAGLFVTSFMAPLLWPILGGSWAGSEYSWGTVRMILSRRPNRIEWTLSAVIMLLVAAGLALVATLVVATIAGSIVAALTGHSAFETAGLQNQYALIAIKVFLAAWLILSFYLVLAYAAGTLFRSGSFGIGAGIGLTIAQLIVYGIFYNLAGAWRTIAQHFPYAYGNALANRVATEGTTSGFASRDRILPGAFESTIGLLVYIAILLAITLYLVRIRDVTS